MTVLPIIGRNYLKPPENEKVPIVVLDFKRMYACWLPGLRHTLYFEEEPATEELKRIRDVYLLDVFGRESKYIIELIPEDFELFETVYSLFSTYGGEIYFYQRKEGRRFKKYFEFKPKKKETEAFLKYSLSDRM
jgi:hypothetical protein